MLLIKQRSVLTLQRDVHFSVTRRAMRYTNFPSILTVKTSPFHPLCSGSSKTLGKIAQYEAFPLRETPGKHLSRQRYYYTCIVCALSLLSGHFLCERPRIWRGTELCTMASNVCGHHFQTTHVPSQHASAPQRASTMLCISNPQIPDTDTWRATITPPLLPLSAKTRRKIA